MKSKLIVAALAISGIAAHAAIDGSKHDFVGASFYKSGGETQLCAPCHAPHGTTDTTIPLWNHATTAPASFATYDSPSMDATTGDPTGSSLACLSCHDGSLAVDGGSGANMTGINSGASVVGSGGDLTHEHPIAFTYTAGNGIKASTESAGSGTIADWLVGGTSMECSSCHDAHNGGTGTKLLRISNDNSALCTTCHDK